MTAQTSGRKSGSSKLLEGFPSGLRAKIEEAAAWKGVSVGSFVADAVGKEAERIIEKERLIELSRQDAETIISLLENPPGPNAALRKAAKLHKKVIDG